MRSFLLSEALCKSMGREFNGYKAFTCYSMQNAGDFSPDLILVDFANLNQGIYEKWPDIKVLLIDTGLSEEDIVNMMRSYKLDGVISLDTSLLQLKKALNVIKDGQIWIDNTKLKAILHGRNPKISDGISDILSKKEKRIVELVADGYKNKEIASILFLSEQTIKSHLGRIFKKMKIRNRSQLVSLTLKNEILGQKIMCK
ncbi:MAG TPA: response regulator transcription factor [Geobacteraceae bacterium]|nr:response regulator transcription factor [Geobacteraceae bacterium]